MRLVGVQFHNVAKRENHPVLLQSQDVNNNHNSQPHTKRNQRKLKYRVGYILFNRVLFHIDTMLLLVKIQTFKFNN